MRVHLAYRERGLDIDVPAMATVIERYESWLCTND